MSARIVVGVTGHRDLRGGHPLEAAIDAVLDVIERQAAPTVSAFINLIVLSPLAEGADRLVAKRVLARGGSELEVVLPMDEGSYAADFKAEGSGTEFKGLLSRARSVHCLPDSSSRAEAYARAGRYVVDHCDVLIALWDGKPEDGPGGTAEIVRYAREKGRELAWIDPGTIS